MAQNCVNPEMYTQYRVSDVTGLQTRKWRKYGYIRIRINLLQILVYLDTGFRACYYTGRRL